jgi:uncharacterized SAM-binding protein YcdF (DUF218 family)
VTTAVVVPGNGALGRDGVYRISKRCRRVVAEAEHLAHELAPRVVVFTGAAPGGGPSEAEQMRAAWQGPPAELVVETTARLTAENASRTLPLLRERGVDRAVVVCARMHAVRTRFFFSRIYGTDGIEISVATVGGVPSPSELAWELVALPLSRRHLRMARDDLDGR